MNSRQLRRQRHAVKMAKTGLCKFGKRMSFLMMKPSPLFLHLSRHSRDKYDSGTHIEEPLIYEPLIGGHYSKGWDGHMDDYNNSDLSKFNEPFYVDLK